MKPLWLLDVDGVINVIAKKPPRHVWPGEEYNYTTFVANEFSNGHPDGEFRLTVRTIRPVVDFIRDAHVSGRVEVRWHTTWQEQAHELGDALGWPRLEVQPAPEFHRLRPPEWWKLGGIRRAVEEGRPVISTDDDSTWLFPKADLLKCRATVPFLMISPSHTEGLIPRHLDKINQFLDLYQEDA